MMKSRLVLGAVGACVVVFCGTGAFAADGPYFSPMIGTSLLSDSTLSEDGLSVDLEFDPGVNLAIMVGTKIGGARFEGEVGYQKNDADEFSGGFLGSLSLDAGGDVDLWRYMANGYYDFNTNSPLTPYVGAGLGFAMVSANDISIVGITIGSSDDTVVAYQFIAGLGYEITESTSVFVDYRYFATEDPKFDGTDAEIESHNISIGLRYSIQ